MSRRYLIIASIGAHAAIGLGLFISGVWGLERLDYRHRTSLTLGAMMPPGEGGGGEGEAEKKPETKPQKKQDKKQKTKVQLRQVEHLQKTEDEPTEVAATGGGGGEGEGEGPDIGLGTGGGGGGGCDPVVEQCGGPPQAPPNVCGDGVRGGREECDDGNLVGGDRCSATCTLEQAILPPNIFTGMRIAGETQIMPPDPVKTEMLHDGNNRTTGSFKLCIDTEGRVSSIAPIGGGTKYAAYDAKITTAMRGWRYRPYTVNNQGAIRAMPACSVVTFVYTIK